MLVLGLLIGAVLGLTGAGGGMLAVPALMFGQGWSVAEAAPAALLAVAAGARRAGSCAATASRSNPPASPR